MSVKKKSKSPVAAKAVDASVTLVEKARAPFKDVVRLNSVDRKRAAKLTRGAHQVIPTIARLATKFAVEVRGFSIDEMISEIEHAQSLEPLLGVIADFHATLRDEYLRAQAASWKTATVTYGMLKKASVVNQSIATELEPVQKWFRHRARGSKPADAAATSTTPKTNDAKPASTSNGASVANGAASTATA